MAINSRGKSRTQLRDRRHMRQRQRVAGTAAVPRMAVYASSRHLYVQFIDDVKGHTLASVSTLESAIRSDNVHANVKGAEVLGQKAAERAIEAGIKRVVFDRGGFKYHGKIAALADAARKTGLNF